MCSLYLSFSVCVCVCVCVLHVETSNNDCLDGAFWPNFMLIKTMFSEDNYVPATIFYPYS